MKGAWRKLRDNRGLTLIELICAVAIFSILATAVGSVLVASAKNYERGSTEINLQQEAQMTANQIADLVIDSTADILYAEDPSSGDKTLEITKADRVYVVTYKSVEMKLYYSEYELFADGSRTLIAGNQLMSEYVSGFSADLTTFGTDGSMQLSLKFAKDGKTYESAYTVTARNGILASGTGDAAATITVESQIVLEPNQDYLLNASAVGTSDTTVNWTLSGNTDSDTKVLKNAGGEWQIHVGRNETASELQLLVMTNAKRSDGVTPLAQQSVQVLIRRVSGVALNVTLLDGTALSNGAKYQITASFSGTNLDKITGLASDNDYVDPRKVDWDYVYTIGGEVVGAEDWYGWPSTQADCYTIQEETDSSLTLILKKDMYTGEQLTVTAVAKHPEGTEALDASIKTNKTGLSYGSRVYATYTFQRALFNRTGDIIYRGTDVNQGSVDVGAMQAITNAMYGMNYWDQNNIWRKFRYREVIVDPATGSMSYGPWTSWLLTTAEAGSTFNIRPADTFRFAPNKDYQVEFKFEAYKNGVVIWPLADTDPAAYSFIGTIDHTKLAFNFPGLGIYGAYGISKDAPTAASCGVTYEMNYCSTDDAVVGIKISNFQNNLQMKVEKYVDGAWVEVSTADCKLELQGNLYQTHKVTFNTAGTYRIEIGLKNITFRTGSFSNPVDTSRDYWLGNDFNGDGYYYFEVH